MASGIVNSSSGPSSAGLYSSSGINSACPDKTEIIQALQGKNLSNLIIREIPSNDTWARDHAAITTFRDRTPVLNDFGFNGWGLKFASDKDNQINRKLYETGAFRENTIFANRKGLILEGGSIESNGEGTLLTTSECLMSPNRK